MLIRQLRANWMTAAVCALLAACAGPAERGDAAAEPVAHLVLCWLEDAGNADHRRRVIERTRALAYAPGMLDLRVGPALPSERGIVDDSFDVGVYMRFRSRAAMQRYLEDPVHKQAVREVFRPLCREIRVHDFLER
jgi:hypothetical protein